MSGGAGALGGESRGTEGGDVEVAVEEGGGGFGFGFIGEGVRWDC